MAGLIPVGRVVDPSRDVFPSTGAHLDVRVIPQFGPQKGKKIDPRTAKTLLQNILIGKEQIPLVQQQGQNWKWNAPITSEYGKRAAPTAGASTFHEGIDVGLGAGTPLAYKGYGTYRPDSGFGSLQTTDPQGNPYEIRFLHTEPGAKAAVGASNLPTAPQLPGDSRQQNEQRNDELLAALLGGEKSLKDTLIAGALQTALARRNASMQAPSPLQAGIITPEQAMQLFA
jgi:hypothetical protein